MYLGVTSMRGDPKVSTAEADEDALGVADAIAMDRGSRVAVRGFVFIDANVGELLCSARRNDDPPTCDGVALTLINLDTNRLDLDVPDDTEGSYDAWSRDIVTLIGRADRTTFVVDDIL
ncbi:MAG: hypothetical protein ACOYXM_06290 [Actinomycetota bacterium]